MYDTILKMWNSSPYLSFLLFGFLGYVVMYSIGSILIEIIHVPKTILNQINISRHGWPPDHLDSDGNVKDDED